MKKLFTIRTVQAAGRRRRCVLARSHGAHFRRALGPDGSVLAPVSRRSYRIGEKSAVNLQLTAQAVRVRWETL